MSEPIIGNKPNKNNNKQRRNPLEGVFSKLSKISFKTAMIILGVFTAFLIFWQIYFSLISFSVYNVGLRAFIIILLLIWSVPMFVFYSKNRKTEVKKMAAFNKVHWGWKIPAGIAAVMIIVCICLAIFTTPMFMAKSYNSMISVQKKEGTAENPVKEFTEEVDDFYEGNMKVAIIDKSFAARLGEKVLGESSGGYASQFEINDYTLIYYKDSLYWVGALEPKGFFQWTSSSKTGSPGYVLVDATQTDENAKAELVQTHKLKYTPGAYLWHDAERQMYFSRMGALRENELGFELDENGVPYYTQVVYKKKFGITSGDDAIGIIVMNATNGDCNYYTLDKAPEWLDNVQSHSMILKQLNYWGEYSNGYFNTWFAKKEVNNTTAGYNYVYNKGHFYITTGITAKSSDDAIIGMVLSDLRTKETTMYNMVGATERAAMTSAQGIQEASAAGYTASFPALINFAGVPTFYMALKDSAKNIKMYAFVNVQEYTSKLVAGNTPEEAKAKYYEVIKNDINNKPVAPSGEEKEAVITRIAQYNDGITYFYLQIGDEVYDISIKIKGAKALLFADAGDTIKYKINNGQITEIVSVTPKV